MQRVKLLPNVPMLLSLSDPTGELDSRTSEVSYPTSDGRTLLLSYKQAVTLNELGLKAGEEFSALLKVDEHGFKTFIPSLSPRAEQERAKEEAPELERQLAQSIAAIPQIVRKAPAKASEPAQAPLTFDRFYPMSAHNHVYEGARVTFPFFRRAKPEISPVEYRSLLEAVKLLEERAFAEYQQNGHSPMWSILIHAVYHLVNHAKELLRSGLTGDAK